MTNLLLRSVALIAPVGASAGRETARWRIRGRARAAARSRRSASYAAQSDVGPFRGTRFLDDLRGEVAHLLQLVDEGLEGAPGLLDAHLHELAQRFRNLRLHECVISHATLLLPYLPSVLRWW